MALILTLGTAWLGLQIFNFRKSPYLKPFIRELISDYALAFAVIVFSLIGAIGFSEIQLKSFKTVPLEQLQITLTGKVEKFFEKSDENFAFSTSLRHVETKRKALGSGNWARILSVVVVFHGSEHFRRFGQYPV